MTNESKDVQARQLVELNEHPEVVSKLIKSET